MITNIIALVTVEDRANLLTSHNLHLPHLPELYFRYSLEVNRNFK